MFRIVRWLVWLVVSLIVVAGLDQALIRVPMKVPVVEQFQEFYVDFRSRLLGLTEKRGGKPSLDQVMKKIQEKPTPAAKAAPSRYLYVDDGGALQFADSLEAVPPAFRQDAQPMER